MKKISSILALATLIFVAFGCRSCETIDSSKLDPSEIYQEYSVAVAENTIVSAEFRVSGSTGTTIALVPPTKVEHNGNQMSEHLRTVFSGTYYSAETKGFEGSHTFLFTDSSGKQFRNTLTFEPIKITSENLILSKTSRNVVVNLSRGLAEGESIIAQLTSDAEPPKPASNSPNSNSAEPSGPDYSNDFRGVVDANARTLTLDTENLKNFVTGKAKLYVTINASKRPENLGIRGGAMSYSIVSTAIPVTVTN
ncbi:MAG: hypothetical protein QM785_20485 [Pyrinomonadaceae bacterium]